jgi:CRP-like cAMP-binding protein
MKKEDLFQDVEGKRVSCRDCKEKSCAAAVLNLNEINLINDNRTETVFRKGDIILHEGTMISHIIYLKSGLVKEYIKNTDEKEQILQIIQKYTYLGLPSLFGDRVNHYSYAALEDIKVCYIDLNVFNGLIKKNGNFAYEILVSVSRDSLNNFHRFINQAKKKTYGRVADALLYFSKIIYESTEFEMPFTRQEFADLIGIARESAARVLTKFKDEGILELDGRFIKIKKVDLLQQISKTG